MAETCSPSELPSLGHAVTRVQPQGELRREERRETHLSAAHPGWLGSRRLTWGVLTHPAAAGGKVGGAL